ncbi:VOC family protein, partial [Streptomyces sp. NPDC055107]
RPRWHVRFPVADLEAATGAARAAGGTAGPPVDSSADGTEAVIRDPDGGIFTVCAHPPDTA